MKKIVCISLMQAVMLINISPIQSTLQAKPQTGMTRQVAALRLSEFSLATRAPEVELLAALLSADTVNKAIAQNSTFKFHATFNLMSSQEDDLGEFCSRARKDILEYLDNLGLELEKLERAMARAAGAADDVLTSPLARRTFRATMQEVGRRLAARGIILSFLRVLGPIGMIFDLLAIIAIADVFLENYLREDLMANNPDLTEDEARALAEQLSDLIADMQVTLQGQMGVTGAAALAGLLHRLELFSEQRSCGSHGRARDPGTQPRRPPPVGDGFPGFGQVPCSSVGYHNSTGPSLPPSVPGGDIEGSFPDSITVTGADPCRE